MVAEHTYRVVELTRVCGEVGLRWGVEVEVEVGGGSG